MREDAASDASEPLCDGRGEPPPTCGNRLKLAFLPLFSRLMLAAGRRTFARLAARPPPADAVAFVGSSTFTYWAALAEDMAGLPAVNAAFGGSLTAHVLAHADRIAALRPRVVVYYCGTNDVTFAQRARAAFENFVATADALRAAPGARRLPIVYLANIASPFQRGAGAERVARVREINRLVRAFADAEAAANGAYLTHVVDVNDEDFARDERFFKWDKLHFTPEGHRRLASVLRPVVADVYARTPPRV
jgi:lysophospholipase L1-like esterase